MIFLHVASVFRHRNLQLRLRDWFGDILSYKYIKEKRDERQNDHSPCGKGFFKFTPPPYLLLHIPAFDPFFVLRGSLSPSKDAGVITHAFTVSQNYLFRSQNRDDIQICSIIKPSSVFFLSFWLRLLNTHDMRCFFFTKISGSVSCSFFLLSMILCLCFCFLWIIQTCLAPDTCVFGNHNPACLACCQKSNKSHWQSVSFFLLKYNFPVNISTYENIFLYFYIYIFWKSWHENVRVQGL